MSNLSPEFRLPHARSPSTIIDRAAVSSGIRPVFHRCTARIEKISCGMLPSYFDIAETRPEFGRTARGAGQPMTGYSRTTIQTGRGRCCRIRAASQGVVDRLETDSENPACPGRDRFLFALRSRQTFYTRMRVMERFRYPLVFSESMDLEPGTGLRSSDRPVDRPALALRSTVRRP